MRPATGKFDMANARARFGPGDGDVRHRALGAAPAEKLARPPPGPVVASGGSCPSQSPFAGAVHADTGARNRYVFPVAAAVGLVLIFGGLVLGAVAVAAAVLFIGA